MWPSGVWHIGRGDYKHVRGWTEWLVEKPEVNCTS